MSSFNQCTFIGHMGKDPEVRYTPGGEAAVTISVPDAVTLVAPVAPPNAGRPLESTGPDNTV